jgi:hypothetical protein
MLTRTGLSMKLQFIIITVFTIFWITAGVIIYRAASWDYNSVYFVILVFSILSLAYVSCSVCIWYANKLLTRNIHVPQEFVNGSRNNSVFILPRSVDVFPWLQPGPIWKGENGQFNLRSNHGTIVSFSASDVNSIEIFKLYNPDDAQDESCIEIEIRFNFLNEEPESINVNKLKADECFRLADRLQAFLGLPVTVASVRLTERTEG